MKFTYCVLLISCIFLKAVFIQGGNGFRDEREGGLDRKREEHGRRGGRRIFPRRGVKYVAIGVYAMTGINRILQHPHGKDIGA